MWKGPYICMVSCGAVWSSGVMLYTMLFCVYPVRVTYVFKLVQPYCLHHYLFSAAFMTQRNVL